MLILAGAGSGKTKVLTHKVAYLVKEKHIAPENILAVTFTNKAATEMRTRVEHLLADQATGAVARLPWLGTFHAICVKILRREAIELGLSPTFSIYDAADQKQVLKRVIEELRLDPKVFQANTVSYYISGAKNEVVDPAHYASLATGYFQEQIAAIYDRYQKSLREANALDFDDLIMSTVDAFKKNEKLLQKYQDLFRYILIDEYQDTNAVQYQFTKLLAAKWRNLCVVGDDYQAIYSWRGANFRNILDFERDYPDAYVVKLEQNYRSTKIILEGASAVIAKNVNRTDKKLWTDNHQGAPITLYQALNEIDEAEFIAHEIKSLARSGHYEGYQSMAILYRTNAQSRMIEEVFLKMRIPYKIVGGVRFYERKEIKDAIAYLRLINNYADKVSFERVINVPARSIGEKSFAAIQAHLPRVLEDKEMQIASLSGKAAVGFERFRTIVHQAKEQYEANPNLVELLDYLMRETGYLEWLDDRTPEAQSRLENIGELKSVLSRSQSLQGFLEDVSLISDVDEYDAGKNVVTLMTLHAAKGLEFPVVFMAGMEEGIFPHSRSSFDPMEIEEERRLCYVGMTRAKERLYLLYASERRLYGGLQMNPPSRFIADLPEAILDLV